VVSCFPEARTGRGSWSEGFRQVCSGKKCPFPARVFIGQPTFGLKRQDSIPAQTLSETYCERKRELAGGSRYRDGAKAHILHVDGLIFIDKLDFNAFNECTRLKLSVAKHKRFFGPVNQLGSDRIYTTNKNRSYCTANKIFTCFLEKVLKKPDKAEKILSSEIAKQRATVLERVLGTNNEFYGLRKIRVGGEKRERSLRYFSE